jgi:hypothetical protein
VSPGTLLEARVGYRNFNLCPHCVLQGQQAILCRLCEGIPMISRSDGKLFHLLLADRPIPYPAESKSEASEKLSTCFWYSHVSQIEKTSSVIVILPGSATNHASLFRQIEHIADLLAELLASARRVAGMYELVGGRLVESTY